MFGGDRPHHGAAIARGRNWKSPRRRGASPPRSSSPCDARPKPRRNSPAVHDRVPALVTIVSSCSADKGYIVRIVVAITFLRHCSSDRTRTESISKSMPTESPSSWVRKSGGCNVRPRDWFPRRLSHSARCCRNTLCDRSSRRASRRRSGADAPGSAPLGLVAPCSCHPHPVGRKPHRLG